MLRFAKHQIPNLQISNNLSSMESSKRNVRITKVLFNCQDKSQCLFAPTWLCYNLFCTFWWSSCVLVYFSWLLDHVVYLKLKRELQLCKAKKTIITQNENFVHPRQFWVSFCEFAQRYTKDILFSAWDKPHDPGAN